MRRVSLLLLAAGTLILVISGCKKPPSKQLSAHAQHVIFGDDTTAAQSANIAWTDNAASTIQVVEDESGASVTIINNHTYLSSSLDSIAVSQHTEWVLGDWEGNQPWLEASAMAIDGKGNARTLWALSDSADAGQVLEGARPAYQTQAWGCDGDCTLYRLYNLHSGREILAYNHELINLTDASADTSHDWTQRYIGAMEAHFAADSMVRADGLAIISYASGDATVHQVLLRAKTPEAHERTYEGHFELTYTPLDSALRVMPGMKAAPLVSVSTLPASALAEEFAVRIAFGDNDPVFVIPLRDDDFVIEKPNLDEYEIVRLK